MTVLILILCLLSLILCFILFARLKLQLNTLTGSYYIEMGKIIRISFHWKEKPLLHFRILFIHFNVEPLKIWSKRKKRTKPKALRQGKRRSVHFRKVLAVIKSFRVVKFHVSLDTTNVISNAALFPAAAAINRFTPFRLNINYSGENYAVIHIENRVARILWAYINH